MTGGPRAAGQAPLQYVTIDDFSPGIYDDWFSGGGAQTAPQGAAQLTGTFGCVSAHGGGLIPAPLRINRLQETLIQVDGANLYPPNDNMVHVTAFRSLSPVLDRTGVGGSTKRGVQQAFPDQLFFTMEWHYGALNAWKHTGLIRTYKMNLQTSANPALGTVTTFDLMPTNADAGNAIAPFVYGFSGLDISRTTLTPGSPAQSGPAICAASYTSNQDITNFFTKYYPNVATPNTDSTATMGINNATYGLFAHSDRIMLFMLTVNNAFGTTGELPDDIMSGTVANDVTSDGFDTEQFCNENPGLFGSWCSMNASEALFIKQQRGGFTMRSDPTQPTIVRLPSLPPTGPAINIGCAAKNGMYIYGTKESVWGWTGGDTATDLAPNIDGWFWKPGSGIAGVDQYLFTKGSFAMVGNYLFAPNGFCWDMRTGGWWKYTQPTDPVYAFHDVSANGNIICVPASFSASRNVLADWYDIQQGQSSYQWTSQPLKISQGRIVSFRDSAIMIQGTGTVTLSMVGLTTEMQPPVTIQVASNDRPVLIDTPISWHGTDMTLILTSNSGSSAAAPRIYRVTLGYEETQTARLPQ
jgi:hypothetical protein